MNQSRPAILIACTLLLPLLMLVPACQRYEPAPLDLTRYRAAVAARDPAAAEVVNYARRLAEQSSSTTRPATYNPADGLSLDEAEVVALMFNPRLRLARLRADVPRLGAAEAGRWADPEFNFDAERILESVDNQWVLGGTLAFTIPLSGRLGVEKEQANAEASAAQWRALAEERRVIAELRVAWLSWSAAAERVRLTRAHVDDLEAAATRADRLREVGELSPLDARSIRLERVRHAAKLHTNETDQSTSLMRLKALMGLAPDAAVTPVPSLAAGATPTAIGTGADELSGNVRLRVLRAEYAVAERTLELEIRKQYPDLKIGGGFGTDEGEDRVLFGASLPIPILNANRRAIAEARAVREVARATAEGEYEHLLAELAAARVTLSGADARVRYVEQELAPLADKQVQDAVRIGKAGDFNALVLLEALRGAHEAKLEVLDARAGAGLAARRLDAIREGGTSTDAGEAAEEGGSHP